MSLNFHWFQNDQPSKLNDKKMSVLVLKRKFFFDRSTLTAGHFGTSGSSETLCTSFERSNLCVIGATKLKGVTPLLWLGGPRSLEKSHFTP